MPETWEVQQIRSRLEDVAGEFRIDPASVVSLKLRPGVLEKGEFQQSYWGGQEYSELYRQLHRLKIDRRPIRGSADGGLSVEEHESGPELIGWGIDLLNLAVAVIAMAMSIQSNKNIERARRNDGAKNEVFSIEERRIDARTGKVVETKILVTKPDQQPIESGSKEAEKILKVLRGGK